MRYEYLLRFIAITILFGCKTNTLSAQLAITPGAQFSIAGNMQLTLQNADLINNGNFNTGNGIVTFTGNNSSSIGGTQPIQFFELEMNKAGNASVLLQRKIGATQRILFSSGLLNLNGFDADLGTTGHLDGEQENTGIIGPNGGEVLFNVNLNSPTGSNPANLGIFITSNQDLGNVTIKRGHALQVTSPVVAASILRYYDIIPANNTNLDATLRFRYFNRELIGFNENSIVFFESQNNLDWTNLGFTSRDTVANFVQKNGINNFGRFTLSDINSPLSVGFTGFNVSCQSGRVVLTWKTAQEQNSSHFDIERSVDAIHWTVIDNLPAAGNSSIERSYSFTDNNPIQNGYYRIAEYDLDGRSQYTSILSSSCNLPDGFLVWPNPFQDEIFINITTASESSATIKVFDYKGALVKLQTTKVLPGSNQLSINIGSVARGVYLLNVEWDNGKMRQTVQIIKQ